MIVLLGAALAAGWTALALAGGATVGSLFISPLAAAAGAGAASIGLTVMGRRDRDALLTVPLVLVLLPMSAALAAGGHTALPLVGCAFLCLLTVGRAWRTAALSLVAGEIGVGLALAGLAVARGDLHAGVLTVETAPAAGLLAASAAAFIAAAGLAPAAQEALRCLVVPGVVIGWMVAARVDGVAVVGAALALVALIAARRSPTALAFAAVAVAAVGPARPAAALLAAGAVLAFAVGPSVGWPAALPGAIAAPVALAATTASVESIAAGVAVIAAAVALAGAVRGTVALAPRLLPAAVLMVWLTLAPTTWTWAGEARLGDYEQGVSRAVAAGLLVSVVAWMTGQLRPPAPEWRSSDW